MSQVASTSGTARHQAGRLSACCHSPPATPVPAGVTAMRTRPLPHLSVCCCEARGKVDSTMSYLLGGNHTDSELRRTIGVQNMQCAPGPRRCATGHPWLPSPAGFPPVPVLPPPTASPHLAISLQSTVRGEPLLFSVHLRMVRSACVVLRISSSLQGKRKRKRQKASR